MNPTERDRLLALFGHAAADAPAGPHVADDDELLTAWRLGDLSPAEDARLHEHLATCADCRRHVADLAATSPIAEPTPKKSSWRSVIGVVAALAACVVLAVGWFVLPSSAAREVARAETEVNDGKPDAALARLMRVSPDRLPAAQKEKRQALLERAAYQAVRGDVEAGRFEDATTQYEVASAAGAKSARLDGLRVLADRRLPLKPALSPDAGSLLDRGYLPNGANPTMSVPVPNDALRAAWVEALTANPDDPATLVNAGEFLLSQLDLGNAEEVFRRAVEHDPKNVAGHIGLGLTAAARDRFDAALRHFVRALELAPDSPALLVNVAVCYEALNDPETARTHWELALERATDPKLRTTIARHLKKG